MSPLVLDTRATKKDIVCLYVCNFIMYLSRSTEKLYWLTKVSNNKQRILFYEDVTLIKSPSKRFTIGTYCIKSVIFQTTVIKNYNEITAGNNFWSKTRKDNICSAEFWYLTMTVLHGNHLRAHFWELYENSP